MSASFISTLRDCLIRSAALFLYSSLYAEKISPLGTAPTWEDLDVYSHSISHNDFQNALDQIYSDPASYAPYLFISEDKVEIRRNSEGQDTYELPFAADAISDSEQLAEILRKQNTPKKEKDELRSTRYWQTKTERTTQPDKPLANLTIALDPGHLGGSWAKMEERWFMVEGDQAIQEGDLTLFIANLLKPQLEALGADVRLLRKDTEPLTDRRPKNLINEARLFLRDRGIVSPPETYDDPTSEEKIFSVQWQSEKLFYRISEIRERARRINKEIQPDLVLCLHFNAEGWGDPAAPSYVENNHFHLLINGSYDINELAYDDIRFEMLRRLLQGCHLEELALAEALAPTMAQITELPPYIYPGSNARRVNEDPYIFARNLLANRLYTCPVLYFEPYVMNNKEVYQRLAAGDFAGRTLIEASGKLQRSIYQDYVNGVIKGLLSYYADSKN